MKRLFIIRHAKSSWDDGSLHDIERPLAERGVKDAAVMGKMLHKKGVKPDVILSSPALRAFSTARIFCAELGIDKNSIIIQNDLYFGEPKVILSVLHSIAAEIDIAFIFGHNPSFTNLAAFLCHRFNHEMPTCSIVSLEFPVESWGLVEEGSGQLLSFDYPKMYR